MKIITKDEIALKLLEVENASLIFALTEKNRQFLRKTLPWLDLTKQESDTKAFIEKSVKEYSEGESAIFSIFYHDELVGIIGFNSIDMANRSAKIGYWIDEDLQGKGIITESCKILIRFGFDELDLNRIQIDHATDNPKSGAVPERLGFTREGVKRQSAWLYDHFQDMITWSLLKKGSYILKNKIMKWNVYTLSSATQNLNGVMLRGRIRKFGIMEGIDILAENTEDIKNGVRIAILSETAEDYLPKITNFLKKIISDIGVNLDLDAVQNPILSKLKCNDESRYTI